MDAKYYFYTVGASSIIGAAYFDLFAGSSNIQINNYKIKDPIVIGSIFGGLVGMIVTPPIFFSLNYLLGER